jgi:hypothetical protein
MSTLKEEAIHPTEKVTPERPSDDPQELSRQLKEVLESLGAGPFQAELYRAYLTRFQVLAWRGVADGCIEAPQQLQEALRAVAEPFIAKYIEEPPTPEAAAAADLWFTFDALGTASWALAERRVEDRLSQERVSQHEREILRVLAGSQEFLRRGEIHATMQNPPTIARVGQILVEMFYTGILSRIHGRAQGNPNASFYALSEKGRRICRDLGILEEVGEPQKTVAGEPTASEEAVSSGDSATKNKLARLADAASEMVFDSRVTPEARSIAAGVVESARAYFDPRILLKRWLQHFGTTEENLRQYESIVGRSFDTPAEPTHEGAPAPSLAKPLAPLKSRS